MNTATWYHCSMKVISRSTGRTAIAAAAYRSGTRLHDNQLDQTYDYTRRRGVENTFILAPDNAPEWAYHLESLWNEAQAKDNRKNSCLAREIELALPGGIDAEGRAAIAQEFSRHLVERYGVAVSAALHEPSRYGDQNNYHAHILFTTRRMDAEGFSMKTRELDERRTGAEEVEHLREYAASLINSYLEDAGSGERVDHRSYADRGIDQTPTGHLGVEAAAMERRGEHSRIGDENREIAEHNRRIDQLVSELAAVDAEIERELEKEFLQSAPEADIIPSFPFPAVHEGAPPSVLAAAPEPVKTWEEQKREAQSPFTSEVTTRMEHDIRERGEVEAEIAREFEKEVGVEEKPGVVLPFPAVQAQPSSPVMTWEEQKRAAQSPFTSEVTTRMEHDIREHGEVQENHLGKHWFDRSLTMFENLYYNTIEQVKGIWQEYIEGRSREDRDDPDMGDRDR